MDYREIKRYPQRASCSIGTIVSLQCQKNAYTYARSTENRRIIKYVRDCSYVPLPGDTPVCSIVHAKCLAFTSKRKITNLEIMHYFLFPLHALFK